MQLHELIIVPCLQQICMWSLPITFHAICVMAMAPFALLVDMEGRTIECIVSGEYDRTYASTSPLNEAIPYVPWCYKVPCIYWSYNSDRMCWREKRDNDAWIFRIFFELRQHLWPFVRHSAIPWLFIGRGHAEIANPRHFNVIVNRNTVGIGNKEPNATPTERLE